jgi:hypothetical protein
MTAPRTKIKYLRIYIPNSESVSQQKSTKNQQKINEWNLCGGGAAVTMVDSLPEARDLW